MPLLPATPLPDSGTHLKRSLLALALCLGLGACAVPGAPAPKTVFDFGPLGTVAPVPGSSTVTPRAPLALADIETSQSLESTALQYRLGYANAQELRPYALARWSMPPAQLVQQRVRAALALSGPVLTPGEASSAYTLKLDLEEFSQQFSAPTASQGVVQLRATLIKGSALAAQQSFNIRAPAPTADAAGGANALAEASRAAAELLATWVTQHMR